MQWSISVSYGELVLKGKNKHRFIAQAMDQMDRVLEGIPVQAKYQQDGKVFFDVAEEDVSRACSALQQVFGLVYVTPCVRVRPDMESIEEAARYMVERKLQALHQPNAVSFKVEGKRSNKGFPMNSLEIAMEFGARLLDAFPALHVDVKHPEFRVFIEVRHDVYVYTDRLHGAGGLPYGSGGSGLLLLSGGIDSPAAAYAMARRGLRIGAVHFHAYPYTSEQARDKTLRLAKQLRKTVGPIQLYMVNLSETYVAIAKHCRSRNTTVLSRRMMMRIAERIAEKHQYDALITGESLGQVASQTVQGLHVVNAVTELPILRPFIATDKVAIIDLARKIGTYDISIEPFDDCCSIFAPDRPNTHPRLTDLLEEEKALDIEALLQSAWDSLEVVEID